MSPFEQLKGKTITKLIGLHAGSYRVNFECSDNSAYLMYHSSDCCENVEINEVIGDVSDILNSEILLAEEIENDRGVNPTGVIIPVYQDSFTWTFYKLSTIKGSITIRWYGESNGYYSESVSFVEEN